MRSCAPVRGVEIRVKLGWRNPTGGGDRKLVDGLWGRWPQFQRLHSMVDEGMSVERHLVTYEGHCHCGAVNFRFRSEPITEGRRCNCSICIRKGAVVSARYYQPEEFELLQGRESLSIYKFGDCIVNH